MSVVVMEVVIATVVEIPMLELLLMAVVFVLKVVVLEILVLEIVVAAMVLIVIALAVSAAVGVSMTPGLDICNAGQAAGEDEGCESVDGVLEHCLISRIGVDCWGLSLSRLVVVDWTLCLARDSE